MFEFHVATANDLRADIDDIVVADGAAVFDFQACNHEEDAGLFELCVGNAAVTEEIGAGDFEPGRVAGVVGDAHGVALGVADADAAEAFGGKCGRRRVWVRVVLGHVESIEICSALCIMKAQIRQNTRRHKIAGR